MSRDSMSRFVDVTTSEAEEIVFRLWKAWLDGAPRMVVYLESPPGTGKTSTAKRLAKRMAEHLSLDLRANHMDPAANEFGLVVSQFGNKSEEVIAGLPFADKSLSPPQQMRAMANDFPRTGRGLWAIDEPFQVSYAWRFVAQIVSEGGIGLDYHAPDNWFFLLLGNGHRDRAGAMRMPTHIQNRIITIRVRPSVEGALANFRDRVTPAIGVYLRWFGDGVSAGKGESYNGKLMQFDRNTDGPWASPRVWDQANSAVLHGFTPLTDFPVFQGLLGTDTALDLQAYWRAVDALPPVNDLLADPDGHAVLMEAMHQKDPTRSAALAFVILRKLDVDRDVDAAGRAIRLFSHASLEATAAFLQVADMIDQKHADGKQTLDHPEYARLVAKHPNIFVN